MSVQSHAYVRMCVRACVHTYVRGACVSPQDACTVSIKHAYNTDGTPKLECLFKDKARNCADVGGCSVLVLLHAATSHGPTHTKKGNARTRATPAHIATHSRHAPVVVIEQSVILHALRQTVGKGFHRCDVLGNRRELFCAATQRTRQGCRALSVRREVLGSPTGCTVGRAVRKYAGAGNISPCDCTGCGDTILYSYLGPSSQSTDVRLPRPQTGSTRGCSADRHTMPFPKIEQTPPPPKKGEKNLALATIHGRRHTSFH